MQDPKSQFFSELKEDFKDLGKRMSTMFDGFVGSEGDVDLKPAVDIYESKDAFFVVVELAGTTKKDVKLQIKDNTLHISGTRSMPESMAKEKFLRKEIKFGKYSRSFNIPNGVELEGVKASFTEGMLSVRFPKENAEEPESETINIEL